MSFGWQDGRWLVKTCVSYFAHRGVTVEKKALYNQKPKVCDSGVISSFLSLPAVLVPWCRAKKCKHFAALTVRSQSGTISKVFLNLLIQFYVNNMTNLHQLTLLSVTSCLQHGGRISFAAPTVWNSIPLSIRQSPSIGFFKRHLKTHLFTLPS